MNQPTDIQEDLIERCKKGDRRAQSEIYHRYSKAMYNTSLRILNSRVEAEDILQESFISAFRNLKDFRGESSFGSWIKRIVINKSLNEIKKKKIPQMEINEDILDFIPDEETTDLTYTIDHVKQALSQLSEGYRVVFSLFMFEDYSHRQIADAMDITVSTSKSQLNRAKKRVKEIILNNYEQRQA